MNMIWPEQFQITHSCPVNSRWTLIMELKQTIIILMYVQQSITIHAIYPMIGVSHVLLFLKWMDLFNTSVATQDNIARVNENFESIIKKKMSSKLPIIHDGDSYKKIKYRKPWWNDHLTILCNEVCNFDFLVLKKCEIEIKISKSFAFIG